MGTSPNEQLASQAFKMAYKLRQPDAGFVHHSDRGSAYTAGGYQAQLKACGALTGLSRAGNCWDNAVCESWFANLKKQWLENVGTVSFQRCRGEILEYIAWYNSRRVHSSLDYRSPIDYEADFWQSASLQQAA